MQSLLSNYNEFAELLLSRLDAAADSLRTFMFSTKPYQIQCARKKLIFFLFCETGIVFSVLHEARKPKKPAKFYLLLKIIAVNVSPARYPAASFTQFAIWMVVFFTGALEILIMNFSIVCMAWGNEKGKRIWMRVTPKRKMYETISMAIYNPVKVLLIAGVFCTSWFPDVAVRASMHLPRSLIIFQGTIFYYVTRLAEDRYLIRKIRISPLWKYSWSRAKLGNIFYYRDAPLRFNPKWSAADGFLWAGICPDLSYFVNLAELDTVSNLRYGVLFILALSSLTVYSIILAGWSSNSKYAFLGALRSAAQMISYEVSISLCLLPVILLAGSLNLTEIVFAQSRTIWFLFPLLPIAMVFLVSMLAETNRTPFDLPEAEAELVAGYNVDYSSLPFAMFFLGEYANMILISVFFCILFLGGWEFAGLESFPAFILALKATVPWVFFVLVRATLPRYRYDQLMDIGWKAFLPLTGAFLMLVIGLIVFLDVPPVVAELPF